MKWTKLLLLNTGQYTGGQAPASCVQLPQVPRRSQSCLINLDEEHAVVIFWWGWNSGAAICNPTGLKDLWPETRDEATLAYRISLIGRGKAGVGMCARLLVRVHASQSLSESPLWSWAHEMWGDRWTELLLWEGGTDGKAEILWETEERGRVKSAKKWWLLEADHQRADWKIERKMMGRGTAKTMRFQH